MNTVTEPVFHVNDNHENHNCPDDIKDHPVSSATITPLRAIRRFCVACVGSPYEVPGCGGDACLDGQGDKDGVCFFYRYRNGKGAGKPSVKLIRKMCLECMEGLHQLVTECKSDCHLHKFRFGKNPNVSDERREKQRVIFLKSALGGS